MKKTIIRTLSVLLATLAAVVLVYGVVSLATVLTGGTTTISPVAAGVQACPRTGCTSTDCHGATGAPPPSGGYGRHRRHDDGSTSGEGAAAGASSTYY